MTTPSSTISAYDINQELKKPVLTSSMALNDTNVRSLAQLVTNESTISYRDLRNKTTYKFDAATATLIASPLQVVGRHIYTDWYNWYYSFDIANTGFYLVSYRGYYSDPTYGPMGGYSTINACTGSTSWHSPLYATGTEVNTLTAGVWTVKNTSTITQTVLIRSSWTIFAHDAGSYRTIWRNTSKSTSGAVQITRVPYHCNQNIGVGAGTFYDQGTDDIPANTTHYYYGSMFSVYSGDYNYAGASFDAFNGISFKAMGGATSGIQLLCQPGTGAAITI